MALARAVRIAPGTQGTQEMATFPSHTCPVEVHSSSPQETRQMQQNPTASTSSQFQFHHYTVTA